MMQLNITPERFPDQGSLAAWVVVAAVWFTVGVVLTFFAISVHAAVNSPAPVAQHAVPSCGALR